MSNILKGGRSDKMSVEDIARKHSQFVGTIKLALERGLKVEREHSSDKNKATEIAMDHLSEDPDYYEKLEKMETGKYCGKCKRLKKKCTCKKEETKEQTMSDSSGSFEGPIFGKTIQKKDVHKLHNFSKINEVADSGISAGAMYDAPIGHKTKDPLEIDNPETSDGNIMANRKTDKKSIAVKKPNFPKFGGPESKFVEINPKCKKFPYCNQGDPKNMKLYEVKGMREAIKEAARKYGLTIAQVEKMVIKESRKINEAYSLPSGIDISPALKWGRRGEDDDSTYHLMTVDRKTNEPIPLDYSTRDEIEFSKLKQILISKGISFKEDKYKGGGGNDIPMIDEPEDDDTDFDNDDDDIFANMK